MKTQSKDTRFGVLGLGYVGLPLAIEAARNDIAVIGFDVQQDVVDGINAGRTHIRDLEDLDVAEARDRGLLEATTDMSRLQECDVISICVPTPLGKTRDPDISYVIAASEAVGAALKPGQLIVLESTTYPGTTRDVLLPILSRRGYEAGRDFFLCFSPERVDPANEVWKTKNTPKVIGGITPQCTEAGVGFYSRFVDQMVPVSSAEAAEMTKILENTFRAVNIGLVNEIALISDRLSVDVWEVIDAAATKPFGFMKFTPGPGLGGHCIPIDPHYLSWKMRSMDYRTRFIELASEINAEMPNFVIDKVRQALNNERKSVNGAQVLVLGVAYKKNVDDVRESPAGDIVKGLERDGAEVLYHDPFVSEWQTRDGRLRTSTPLDDSVLRSADAVVVVTDHSDVDYQRVFELAQVLVDARNVTAGMPGVALSSHPQRWIVKGGAQQPVSEPAS